MGLLSDFFTDFVDQAGYKPIQTTSVIVAWLIVIGVGLYARRFRPKSWIVEWLIWTYVGTAILQSLVVTRALIYEGVVFAYYNDYGIFWQPLIFLFALLTDLLWPLSWGAMLVATVGEPFGVLALFGIIASMVLVGGLSSAIITVGVHGWPRRLSRQQQERLNQT